MERIINHVESRTAEKVEAIIESLLKSCGIDTSQNIESIERDLKEKQIRLVATFQPGEYPLFKRSYTLSVPGHGSFRIDTTLDATAYRVTGRIRTFISKGDNLWEEIVE